MTKFSKDKIDRVISGSATRQETQEMVAWFSTDQGRQALSMQMDEDLRRLESGELESTDKKRIEAIYERIEGCIKAQRYRRMLLRTAAVIIPLGVFIASFIFVNSRVGLLFDEYAQIVVPRGERIQVVFQDGSKAYVNSESRLTYPVKFGLTNRRVQLDGEAYFVVTPNPRRPFIVELDQAEVNVLGTSFDVKARSNENIFMVTLDEGKVNMVASGKIYTLKPEERLTYDRSTKTGVITKDEQAKSASLWKDNIIVLKNAPLHDVMTTLGRWYDVEFVVKDQRAYQYSYNVKSNNIPLESILSDLETLSPVRFRLTGKQVTVTMER